MAKRNPIAYASRTFNSILSDINSDPELADKPEWFKRMIAGVGDVISVWNNAAANNLYLRTAFSRRAMADIVQLIGYKLAQQSTASGEVLFDIGPEATLPFTVSQSDLVANARGGASPETRRFEARGSLSVESDIVSADASDWDDSTDEITVAHVFYTGEKVRVQSPGTLPTPIEADTDYYTIKVADDRIKLAESREDAFSETAIDITATGSGGHEIVRLSRAVTLYQQELQEWQEVGESDGSTEWQEFFVSDRNILENTVEVRINDETWTKVSSFAESGPDDKVFETLFLTDGTMVIGFGDGEYGRIPDAFPIEVRYAVGGGADSNVNSKNRITVYDGDESRITGCTNPVTATGGATEETLESARRKAPLELRSRDRFVTTEDGEAMAEGFEGVALAKVFGNAFGTLTARVIGVANGGGQPSLSLREEIQDYMKEHSVLDSIETTFNEGTITATDVDLEIAERPGFDYDDVKSLTELATELFFTEAGREIEDQFKDGSIGDAVDVINSVLGTSLDSSDYDDVQRMLEAYERFQTRDFGETIQETSFIAYVKQSVRGLDFMVINSPTFPIELDEDEITSAGTVTIAEAT